MKTRVYPKLSIFFLIICLILTFSFPSEAASSKREINVPPKRISIVLDNSGSMGNYDRMNYSLYALEVFSALMGENDELWLYTLHPDNAKGPVLKIQGNNASRMGEIHQTLSGIAASGGTPYKVVNLAMKELQSSPDNYEKWLVILSDGEFDGRATPNVQNDLNSLNSNNIHTVFMSIDPEKSYILADNGDMGKYFGTDSSHILETVSSISNMVFSHLVVPHQHIRKAGNTYTLSIDIPIDQLIIFAQGKNAEIQTVSLNSSQLQCTANYPVERVYGRVRLKGVVCRYDQPNGHYYDSGSFQITVSEAEQVDFYYRPAVELECSLINSGKLFAGEDQEAKVFFVHPGTGEQVTSDLLSGAEIYLTVKNNGNKLIDNEKAGSDGKVKKVKLAVGTAEVSAYANLPGYITLRKQSQEYKVVEKATPTPKPTPTPTPTPAPASLQNDLWEIKVTDLKDNTSIGFAARIVDAKTGIPVDQERWEQSKCRADEAYGIKLTIDKKDMQSPNVCIVPSSTGKLSDVQTGDLTFTVYTSNKYGTEEKSEITIRVLPYEPIKIKDASHRFNQFSLGSNNTTEYAEIAVVDKETGASLSDEVFHNTELYVHDTGNGLDWKTEKTQKNGVWKLTPHATGKKTDIKTGTRSIVLEAIYDDSNDFTAEKAIKSSGTLELTIDPTPPRQLDLTVSGQDDPFQRARWNLEAHDPIQVKVTYNGAEFPSTAWADAEDESLQLEWDRSKFDLRVEKSNTPGIWNVYIKPFNGKGYQTAYGTFDVKAEVSVTDTTEEVTYGGNSGFKFVLEPDWLQILLEFWVDWWWAIVGSIILAGYLFKKKFVFFALRKMRKVGVTYTMKAEDFGPPTVTRPSRIKLRIITFLLPFISQRAIIEGSYAPANCSFGKIKAKAIKRFNTNISHASFTITNKHFSLTNVKSIHNIAITPETLSNPDFIHTRKFRLIGFDIQGQDEVGDVKVVRMRN